MEVRLANLSDLSKLKSMYRQVVERMNRNHIEIWDDIYPIEFIHNDIEKKQFYVLVHHNDIVASFALSDSHEGEACVKWKETDKKAIYIDRFAVNIDYLRQGIGILALKHAMMIARQQGAQYLRLFVVESNRPAIHLYLKSGFQRVDGIYDEVIDEQLILHEYGYEMHI